MKTIQTVLKCFAAGMLRGSAGLCASAVLLLALAGCQREEPSGGEQGSGELVVTATIAEGAEDAATKLSLLEDGADLLPRWSVGDAVVGWDADGNTYSLTVNYIKDSGRSAIMGLTSGSIPADGTIIHLVYAPGKTVSDIDATNKQLVVDLSSQDAGTVPALMTASAKVRFSGGVGTMSAVFRNRVALLAIKHPVMGDFGRASSSIKVSGPTTTTLSTKITFSISEGGLVATSGTPGVITKAVSFSSDASGNAPDGTSIYIALCPVTTSTALTLSTDNCELCPVAASTYPAEGCRTIDKPLFSHPWVEIGGIKWSTMNVGATTEAGEYAGCAGDYYAWGATEPWYSAVSWSGNVPTFTWGKSGKSAGYVAANAPYYSSAYTKYTSYPAILEASDDAATAAWGSGWRMPTQTELAILYNACDNGSITSKSSAISLTGSVQSKGIYLCLNADGVKGALFSDGTNQIFFPDARFVEGTSLHDVSDYSMYWSSSLQSGNNAYYLYLDFDYNIFVTTAQGQRYAGAPVRPVRNELAPVPGGDAVTKITGISLSPTSCSLSIGGTQTLTATITPSGATIQDLLWTSSNTSVATVSSAGLVTTLSSGTATITATATDGSGKSATCTVTAQNPTTGTASVSGSAGRTSCGWVQLWEGGPKWATFNVGATIDDYDSLDTTVESYSGWVSGYNTANVGGLYPWHNSSVNGRKTTWGSGVTTGTGDVATALWGDNWKEPTVTNILNLVNKDADGNALATDLTEWTYCDGSTTKYNNCTLKGWKVSGKSGTAYENNIIFLPLAGYYSTTSSKVYPGSYTYYWSSTQDNASAHDLYLTTSAHNKSSNLCYYGMSVRAVLNE